MPDEIPPSDPKPSELPKTDQSSMEPAAEPPSNSSKLVSGAGIFGAFGFIILIIAIRGGKHLLRNAVEDKPESGQPRQINLPQQNQQFNEWVLAQQKLKRIEQIRKDNKLSEEEMDDVLKTVWTKQNKNAGKRPPWMSSNPTEDTDKGKDPPATPYKDTVEWRKMVDWNIQAIEREIVDRRDSKKPLEKPKSGEK